MFFSIFLVLIMCMTLVCHIVTKPHEGDSDDDGEFMHACIIIVFLLIRLLYSSIHSLDCLLQPIQFYSVLTDLIDFAVILSLTAC